MAARHLHMFRYKPTVYLPKPGSKDIYHRLLKQCENLRIPVLKDVGEFERGLKESDVVLDAIFGKAPLSRLIRVRRKRAECKTGFSFHPPVREPFDVVLKAIKASNVPIFSVDIPSGWSVSDGRQVLETQKGETIDTFDPEVLISLTAPKEGVKEFHGRHWLGGRFVPERVHLGVCVGSC